MNERYLATPFAEMREKLFALAATRGTLSVPEVISMKTIPKGATREGLDKAKKRSELLKATRDKRVGLAESMGTPALADYEKRILGLSPRRRKSA